MDKIKLYKPIMVDGKEVKELAPDFENLPTGSSAKAMSFLGNRKYIVVMPDTDMEYNSMLTAMAAGLAPEDAWALHDKDKRRLAREATSFFLSDSEEP